MADDQQRLAANGRRANLHRLGRRASELHEATIDRHRLERGFGRRAAERVDDDIGAAVRRCADRLAEVFVADPRGRGGSELARGREALAVAPDRDDRAGTEQPRGLDRDHADHAGRAENNHLLARL